MNFTKVRNSSVELVSLDISYLEDYKRDYEEVELIVSIERIDTVISSIIHSNRNVIKDKIKDIMENPEGEALMNTFMEKMMSQMASREGGMDIPKGAMKMMLGFTIERIAKMAKEMIPEGAVSELNTELQKIKK